MSSERNNQEILFEAKFILPETNPDGFVREDIHQDLESLLVETFGGFVASVVETYQMDEIKVALLHDDAIAYTVAIPNTSMAIDKLKAIAVDFAGKLEQDFVYFRQPNGEVYFLDVV